MERYSCEDLRNLNTRPELANYNERTKILTKFIYDTVKRYAKEGKLKVEFDVRYIKDDNSYKNNNTFGIIYAYDADQVKIVLSKIKEVFYDIDIKYVQKAVVFQDMLYISWE